MKVPKPSDADKAWFRSVVGDLPGAEIKPMFGNLAGFVNSNMFCGLFGSDLGIRLPPADRERLLASEGAGPFGPAERPMKEYVSAPAGWRDDTEMLDQWLRRGLTHTAELPPKQPKSSKRKR